MIDQGIKASFALGGITAHMVKMHEEGLIDRLIDVQSFDKVAAESLKSDPMHQEVSANEYASFDEPGSATHSLDIVILSALEVDVNFNVNVLVGSDGIIRGAIGGHPDTAGDSALSIIVCSLNIVEIDSLKDRAKSIIGEAAPLPFGDKVVGIVMNRDGSVMDVIKNIVD